MIEHHTKDALYDLPLGEVRFFDQTGSTNDIALAWAADGAPDFSLVYAEEQTAGRGRGTNRWFSPAGSALSFSVIFRLRLEEKKSVQLFSGLGALGVCKALESFGVNPRIKWPNDVLLEGKKVCGVLAEAVWIGEEIDAAVLGIGVNFSNSAIPRGIDLDFPATCIEAHSTSLVDRPKLLQKILMTLLQWRDLLTSPFLILEWEKRLAFQDQLVKVTQEMGFELTGKLNGLDPDGCLRLKGDNGEITHVSFGEVHLRPVV